MPAIRAGKAGIQASRRDALALERAAGVWRELRLQSLGMWRGRVVFFVWTPRAEEDSHLISCRYANRTQTEYYFTSL
jgi:uncharacterized DUF497 family protein